MYNRLLLAILFVLSGSSYPAEGQNVQKIKAADLEKILDNKDNKLYVINFWATWCAPCVAELPVFISSSREYDKAGVIFVFVSLDFPSRIDKQLLPFLQKNKIDHEVTVMMDTDPNLWIDKVDSTWEGNIPATLFINNYKKIRHFYPEPLDGKELRNLINSYL
jgi:thiol-disulfide isomerase/thioredoxin